MSVRSGLSTWPRVLVWSLIATIPTFVAIMIVNKGVIPPLLVQVVVFAALACSVFRWSEKRWLIILTTVLVGLAVLLGIPFAIEDRAHPESGWAFVPSALSFITGVLGVVAGVATITRLSNAPARAVVGGAVVVSVVVLILGAAATLTVKDDAQANGDVVVVAKGLDYPDSVTAKAGQIGLFIENKDLVRHTFVLDGQGVKEELPASTSRRIDVTLPPGSYAFHCDVPGHEEQMKGTLEVTP